MNEKQPYFVILEQEEVEMNASLAQKLVYAAIKSFSSNGKATCNESYLAISKRAGVDDKTAKLAVGFLITNGWLELVGEGTKRGGAFPILKVRYQSKLKRSKFGVERNLKPESFDSRPLSSESSCVNNIQSNKVNNKSNNNITGNSLKHKKVGLTPEGKNARSEAIWAEVNKWSVEKIVQQRRSR